MTVYSNLDGTLMETYITSNQKIMYGDISIEKALEFEHRIMSHSSPPVVKK
jgi:hypothetical protein